MKKRIVNTILCGCFLAALAIGQVFTAGAVAATDIAAVENTSVYGDEYECSDPIEDSIEVEGDELIPDEDVPLGPGNGSGSKVTVKKTKKTKKSRQILAAASPVSKTVTRKTTKKVTKSSVTSKGSVVKQTTSKTTQKSKYKRESAIINITTTINTTIKTTTTPIETGEMNIAVVAKDADAKLLRNFKNDGYKFVVDTGLSTIGLFSSRNRQITLRYQSKVVYHELGHYLAYSTGKTDLTAEFASIYMAEKDKYSGINKAYVTQNASEYFAESYRDYVTSGNELRSERPRTYQYIQKVLRML